MHTWLETSLHWLQVHPEWLGLSIFLLSLAECLALVGLLIPGVVLLFALAGLAGNNILDLPLTLALAFAGGLLGDLLSYALGRGYQDRLHRLPGLRRHPEWLARAEQYIQRYGIPSLLVGRFIGPLRPLLPMTAGVLHMPFVRFALTSVLASAGWALAYITPGWATGAALHLALPEHFWSQAGILLGIGLGAALISGYLTLHHHRHSAGITALLSGAALLGLSLSWTRFTAFDQGLIRIIQSIRSPELDPVLGWLTLLGDYHIQLILGGLLLLILAWQRDWASSRFVLCSLLGTGLANNLLKHLIERTRPEILLEPLTTYSFPSGHTSASFALCFTLGVLAGRERPPRVRLTWMLLCALPAAAVAGSRIYLGVHWPTDILGGILLAGSLCAASLALVQRHSPLPRLQPRTWWIIVPVCLGSLLLYAGWQQPVLAALYRYQ